MLMSKTIPMLRTDYVRSTIQVGNLKKIKLETNILQIVVTLIMSTVPYLSIFFKLLATILIVVRWKPGTRLIVVRWKPGTRLIVVRWKPGTRLILYVKRTSLFNGFHSTA